MQSTYRGENIPHPILRKMPEGLTCTPDSLFGRFVVYFGQLALFVSSMGYMEGRSTSEVGQKFQEMYWPALVANWKVWPIAQAVNFKLMPLP